MRTQPRRRTATAPTPAEPAPAVLPAAAVAGLAAAVADYLLAASIQAHEPGAEQATGARLAYVSGSLAWLGRQGAKLTPEQVDRVAVDLSDRTPLEVIADLDRGQDD